MLENNFAGNLSFINANSSGEATSKYKSKYVNKSAASAPEGGAPGISFHRHNTLSSTVYNDIACSTSLPVSHDGHK